MFVVTLKVSYALKFTIGGINFCPSKEMLSSRNPILKLASKSILLALTQCHRGHLAVPDDREQT